MNKGAIKQFLRPDWWKMLFFFMFTLISVTDYLDPSSILFEFLRFILFLPSYPVALWLSAIFHVKYSWDSLIIGNFTSLIYSYVLSCAVVSFWSNKNRKGLLKGIIITANILLALYVSFMAYFISGWFISDHIALDLTGKGWVKIIDARVISFCIIGLIVSGILFMVDKFLFTNVLNDKQTKLPLYFAIIIFSAIVIASVAGGLYFLFNKPFI